jgi:hypothetical protein
MMKNYENIPFEVILSTYSFATNEKTPHYPTTTTSPHYYYPTRTTSPHYFILRIHPNPPTYNNFIIITTKNNNKMTSHYTMIHSQDSREIFDCEKQASGAIVSMTDGTGESSLTDFVVRAASHCNQMIVEKCGMCTVYCDEQIQYEITAASLSNFYYNDNPQVQAYRDNLFDEESVVDSICDRV